MKKFTLILICLLTTSFVFSAVNLKRVEPMNWWVGMKNQNLQLLVYGEDISTTIPKLTYSGVTLNEVIKVENPNYLFLDLTIAKNTIPGKFNIEFTLGKKIVDTYEYELKERNNKENIHQGFDASDVIYLLMPDRFSNGNPDNDSTDDTAEKVDRENPDGRHGGDLQGVINHLDYIQETGFTALWLNPFLENNQEKYSYHGYAISDLYKTDPRHGSNEKFVELVDKAHEKELKIIMDMIFNHCGIAHWFIQDLPMQDWIHQHAEFTRSNFRAPTVSDPYASDYDRNKMLTGWFDKNMPDFNQNNPLLATYLIQNSIWWVEYSGIDGIRVDTQPYPYKEFMAKWSKAVMDEYPEFNIVGEAWLQKIAITAYFQKDAANKDGYNSNMPALTDFPMYFALAKAFNENEGWSEGMARLYYILAQDFSYADPNNLLIFPDNHDLNRYYETMGKDINKYKMGLAFILTTRGIPQIYYGTEILMDGQEHEGHGQIRKDFPGGWEGDTTNAFTKEDRTVEQNEAYNYVSTILNWRKNNEVIHSGKLKHFLPEDGIYVMFRYTEDDAVMVILNNNNTDDKTLKTDHFAEILNQYTSGKEITTGLELKDLSTIQIKAKSAMIIDLMK
ncbi:MAG: glycoside hydrolase family 13 protein [Salinivirgaceae bacterium]|nr:glycoside hydrolase family 13 protein [Salinivirgaceae bacterium]